MRRASRHAPVARALSAVLCAGCSGDAFHLAADAAPSAAAGTGGSGTGMAPGNGGLSGLEDAGTLSRHDAESPTTPDPGRCGFPRVEDSELANREVCLGPAQFTMGSAEANLGGSYADHMPPHEVSLSPYFIDAYEVTVSRFRVCVEAGACPEPKRGVDEGCTYARTAGSFDQYPVTCLSWQAAQDFCAWDGERRLPTEAEWEFAARGEAGTRYPWGDSFECRRAVLSAASECPEYAGTTPLRVGLTPTGASPAGVYDLAGNAWEWVFDRAASYSPLPQQDPTGPASGSTRILRGGNWLTLANGAVGYARRGESPGATAAFSFRCARTPSP